MRRYCKDIKHIIDVVKNKHNTKEYIDESLKQISLHICVYGLEAINKEYLKRFGKKWR